MPTLPDIPQAEIAIVELTNAYRKTNGHAEVRPNVQLTAAARAYAAYLAQSPVFSHSADGREPADRAKAAGYSYCQVAENLAFNLDSRGFTTRQLAREVVNGWIASPGHRTNLVAPNVTDIGVGVAQARDKDPKFISVQLFGRPESLKYTFQIANRSRSTVVYRFGAETHEAAPNYTITHTSCEPGTVNFERAGAGAAAKTLSGRYEARHGQIFLLKSAPGGSISIEVRTK